MDKNVIITMGLMTLIGIAALNFKEFFHWIWTLLIDNILFTLKVDESSQFFYGVQNYLVVEKTKKIKNYYYRNIYDNWIDGETTRDVHMFYNRGLVITRVNGRLIILMKTNTNIQNSQTPYKNEKQTFKIIAFSRKAIEGFVDHIKVQYMTKHIRHFFNNNGEIMVYGNINNKTFNNIFLNGTKKEEIIADLDRFTSSQELYKKLGLKYKRTYLFYGGAGNGKSSLATAIANHTRRDILAINLSKDMTDSTLISLVGKRPQKSIVLFEDIDCLFEELNRQAEQQPVENTEKKDDKKSEMIKVTLSCLLNILDGSFTPDDTIFIITTNHIEKLDPALRRDGRVNMLMEITLPDEQTTKKYVEFLRATKPDIQIDENKEHGSIASLEKYLV